MAQSGDRYFYTEFHFRDLATGDARKWVIDGPQLDETGADLFQPE